MTANDLEAARARLADLFDAALYRAQTRLGPQADAFAHYFREGWALRPNVVFDPAFYRGAQGVCPLLHYAETGEPAGADPSALFDVAWYRRTYGAERPLAHYLAHRFGRVSPNPDFDAAFYLDAYPDVAAAGMDPFQHYLGFGFRDFRWPRADFNPKLYANTHMRAERAGNPLVHWRMKRPSQPAPRGGAHEAARKYARPGLRFEPPAAEAPGDPRILALAFHLPQFHRIAENDAWWGEGFTEWSLLARGQPRFEGHCQPRIPGGLGFYDLSDRKTLAAQAKLAKAAGIGGFVFYHYDFGGKRLLEAPVDHFLQAPGIDIGFCLMWANENWTRRWDGAGDEVLIAQDYDPAHEPARLADFARHFRDPRYIRLQGRPLLMIYRAGLIPDTAATLARWRRHFALEHGENPLLLMAQTFGDIDPRPLGLDGAIEFPPHKLTRALPQVFAALDVYDDAFEADVFAYDDVVAASLTEAPPDFPLIKTAVPSWDNDARRQGKGLTLVGATPLKYERWLTELAARAQPWLGARLVAINAWNEWSEGACLEPDVHFGWAYLNATRRAMLNLASPKRRIAVSGGGESAAPAARRLAAIFGIEAAPAPSVPEPQSRGATLCDIADATSCLAEFELREELGVDPLEAFSELFEKLWPGTSKVSVFVLHDQGAFHPERLRSVLAQTYPIWEVVALFPDEASVDVIESEVSIAQRDVSVHFGVEAGLQTAAALAKGDLVWIVDSRGTSDPAALALLAAPFAVDADAAFSFGESAPTDASGRVAYVKPSPLAPAARRVAWADRVLSGAEFHDQVTDAPARSAVLWRREALNRALGTHPNDDLALCRAAASAPSARIHYVAEAINFESQI